MPELPEYITRERITELAKRLDDPRWINGGNSPSEYAEIKAWILAALEFPDIQAELKRIEKL